MHHNKLQLTTQDKPKQHWQRGGGRENGWNGNGEGERIERRTTRGTADGDSGWS